MARNEDESLGYLLNNSFNKINYNVYKKLIFIYI